MITVAVEYITEQYGERTNHVTLLTLGESQTMLDGICKAMPKMHDLRIVSFEDLGGSVTHVRIESEP